MKNKTLTLVRVLLKSGSGLRIDAKNRIVKYLIYALVAVGFLLLFTSLCTLAMELYSTLALIEQQGLMLGLGMSISSTVILVFGIAYVMSSFYFSSDIENFLPLPIKPREIIAAKFLVVVLFEYLISAFILVPVFAIYGVNSGVGPLFYIYSLVIFSLVPVVPLIISSVIAMIIMRFTNLSKHKDLFRSLSGVIGFVVAISINFFMQSLQSNITPEELEQLLLQGNNSLAFMTSRMFPTVKWAVEALLNYNAVSGLLNLLVFVGISILLFILLLFFGELVYIKGVMGVSETSRRRMVTLEKLRKKVKQSSQLWAYTLVELKVLFRTPVYFLNCVLMNLLWPLLALAIILLGGSGECQALAEFFSVVIELGYGGFVLSLALAAVSFLVGSNGITATSISREGEGLYLKKYIPVSYETQISAKVLSSLIISGISSFSLLFIPFWFLRAPFYLVISIVLVGWMPLLFSALVGILIDIYNPKLNWDTEQKAVKQNFNASYTMIITVAFAIVPVFIVFRLHWDLMQAFLFCLAWYGLFNFILYNLVYRQGVAKFNELG